MRPRKEIHERKSDGSPCSQDCRITCTRQGVARRHPDVCLKPVMMAPQENSDSVQGQRGSALVAKAAIM